MATDSSERQWAKTKRPIGVDVLTAAQDRVRKTFDSFDRVYVSFSAGKDSTVLLHLVMDEAIRRGRRVGVLLVDLEGQYKATVEHAQICFALYKDHIDPYWLCLPIALRNAVSVYQPKWTAWEPGQEDAWIRPLPPEGVNDQSLFPWFQYDMEFEELVPEFGEWYAQGEKTACLVGIRADESLNRYRTIANTTKTREQGWQWTSLVTEHVTNVYPIYDWRTEDIWTYHHRNPKLPSNRIYDLMHMAGLKPSQQRLCQPYGDDQRRGLWLYHILEPDSWARVVARVNGANSGATYMREWGNINGYRKITKPPHLTWQQFAETLVASMPPESERRYRDKILLHCKWWQERGYPDGIPDEAPYELEAKHKAPSWRRICKSLLKNDHWCKNLGFSQHKSSAYKRYEDLMKKRREKWNTTQDALQLSAPIAPVSDEDLVALQEQLARR